MITQQELVNLFDYKDGNLYWRQARQKVKADSKAGTFNPSIGYVLITVNQKRFRAHQLIFMYHHGYFAKEIDHIDGNKVNNKIENLRATNRIKNCQNVGLTKRNTSGYKNVSYLKKTNKWMVKININGKNKNFGQFEDIELADLVAQEARNKYFGNFARHF